jgi:GNAT superfamily N-acetyltransferase
MMEQALIREASRRDLDGVVALNQRWAEAPHDGTSEHGFLSAPYQRDELAALIDARAVVVAAVGEEVVGYYLVDTRTDRLSDRVELIERLVQEGRLPAARYVYRSQAAVAPEHMRRGLARRLLEALKDLLSNRYDVLVGYIADANRNAQEAHRRTGWEPVTTYGRGILAVNRVRASSSPPERRA